MGNAGVTWRSERGTNIKFSCGLQGDVFQDADSRAYKPPVGSDAWAGFTWAKENPHIREDGGLSVPIAAFSTR